MKAKGWQHTGERYEHLLSNQNRGKYILRLYITGATPQSARALANIKRICEQYLSGHYRLEVIDLYQQPQLAEDEQVVAVPTLVKVMPPPMRRILGDMSKTDRVLAGLGLQQG